MMTGAVAASEIVRMFVVVSGIAVARVAGKGDPKRVV